MVMSMMRKSKSKRDVVSHVNDVEQMWAALAKHATFGPQGGVK